MSAFITLEEARDAVEHLIVTDDFVDLINRAGERLYRKGASPGWTQEMDIPVIDSNGEFPVDFTDISHVLAFKSDETPYYITPVETTYRTDRSGSDRFVDLGYTSSTERSYRLAKELIRQDEDYSAYNVKALVKKAYVDVVDDADTFPFQNMDELKLMAMAIQYEDTSDPERAAQYMNSALAERETDSAEFRGPQVLTIGVYDPASDGVTETIN
jgi:hypothetical protein